MITSHDYEKLKTRCLKRVWIEKNNNSIIEDRNNEKLEEIMLIKELGHKYIEKTVYTNLMDNENIIHNVTFTYNDINIKCDSLIVNNKNVKIYLIKNSSNINEKYYDELAIQYYVLKNLGYKLDNAYILYIDTEYIREDELDINKLFKIEDSTNQIMNLINGVDKDIELLKSGIEENEPKVNIGEYCLKEKGSKNALDCECKKYCFRHIPENSIFDISGTYLKTSKKFKLYDEGIIEFKDLAKGNYLSSNAKIQVDCELNNTKIINKEEISNFISNLNYPLYFLDFETINPSIPPYKGTKPFQQILFQYSIHYKKSNNDSLKHYEYLAKEGTDSTREFAVKLIKDLGEYGDIIVYNKSFECSRIIELANMYEDLKDDLLKLNDRIVDLMIIFSKRFYYQKEMKGSHSIKYVLPALCPNVNELDYGKLNIKNGSMAMNAFSTLHLKDESEIKQIREDLLKYCYLDTLAMVRILEKLECIINN